MIYLDYAATTPMDDKALEVYMNVAKHYYGNASSLHDFGGSAKQIRDASAKTISNILNGNPRDIHFTSGATESNFLAVYALLSGVKEKGKHIITSKIEHASVKDVFEKLENEGYKVSWLDVDEFGIVQLDEVKQKLREDTVLVSIQHINSEIGSIQPIKEIGSYLRESRVLFHTDAVQSFGKFNIDVENLNVDAISISAHKVYGPKGVGAVWLNPNIDWDPFFNDIHQTKKLKPGTDNVAGVAAFAIAAKETQENMVSEIERVRAFKEEFLKRLVTIGYDFVAEGNTGLESPYILGLRFPGIEGQFFMLECNQSGMAISTGSACQVGSDQPNRTMKAMGRSNEEAREFIRFSFGKFVKEDHLDKIIPKIDTILKRHFSKVNRTN